MHTHETPKKLHRSSKDKVFAGVCGGLGEYFEIDPVIFRILFIVLTFIEFIGVILYALLWLILSIQESEGLSVSKKEKHSHRAKVGKVGGGKYFIGALLIFLGTLILIFKLFSLTIEFGLIWPIVIIFIGIYLIFKQKEE